MIKKGISRIMSLPKVFAGARRQVGANRSPGTGDNSQPSERELIRTLIRTTDNKDLEKVLRAYRKGELDSPRFRAAMVLYRRATYLEDLLGTKANAEFLEDPRFQEAYQAAVSVSTWGRDIRWRVYNLIRFAGASLRLEGDFVECGVDRGGMSLAFLTYHHEKLPFRPFWLFDTFQGLVREQMTEVELSNLKHTHTR